MKFVAEKQTGVLVTYITGKNTSKKKSEFFYMEETASPNPQSQIVASKFPAALEVSGCGLTA